MNKFDIILRKQPGADIILRKQSAADILVYMLTYYLFLLINVDGIEIDSEVTESLEKYVGTDGSLIEIDALAESVLKRVYEEIGNKLRPEALAEFLEKKAVGNVEGVSIQIGIEDIPALIRQILGSVEDGIEIGEELGELLKTDYEQAAPSLVVRAEESGTNKQDFETGTSELVVDTAVSPLLRSIIDGVCENVIGLRVEQVDAVLNRLRRLIEMDDHPLSDFDDMTMYNVINIRIS